jgi:hypothetical protein
MKLRLVCRRSVCLPFVNSTSNACNFEHILFLGFCLFSTATILREVRFSCLSPRLLRATSEPSRIARYQRMVVIHFAAVTLLLRSTGSQNCNLTSIDYFLRQITINMPQIPFIQFSGSSRVISIRPKVPPQKTPPPRRFSAFGFPPLPARRPQLSIGPASSISESFVTTSQ